MKTSMLARHRVSLWEVLDLLSSDTMVSSTAGAVLDELRDGTFSTKSASGGSNAVMQQSKMEERLLRNAAVIRCVDLLGQQDPIKFVPCPDLRKFALRINDLDGAVAVTIMRRFQPWASSWPERGLVDVYGWMKSRAPLLTELKADGESDRAQAFREGKDKRARGMASRIVADAEVVVSAWVEVWNRSSRK